MTRKTRKRVIALALTVILVVGLGAIAVVGREVQQQREARQAYARGVAAYAQGDYAVALRNLSSYVRHHRDDADALFMFADCRWRVEADEGRHLASATALAREAAAIDPNDPRPLELLIQLYPLLKYHNENRDAAAKLLALKPNDEAALRALVDSSIILGDKSGAMNALDAWLVRYPTDLEMALLKAKLLVEADDLVGAIDVLDRVKADHAADPRPFLESARLLARAGDTEQMVVEVRQAAQMDPPDAKTMIEVAELLDLIRAADAGNDLGLEGASMAYLDRHAGEGELANAARAYRQIRIWKRGNLIEMAECEAINLDQVPDFVAGWLGLAIAIESPGAPIVDKIQARLNASSSPESFAWSQVLASRSSLLSMDVLSARNALQDATTAGGAPIGALYLWAALEVDLGEWQGAISRLERVVSPGVDPLWIHPHLMRAETLLNQGQYEPAAQAALEASELFRNHSSAWVRLRLIWADAILGDAARGLASQSQIADVEFAMARILELAPDFVPAHAQLGRASALQSDEDSLMKSIDAIEASSSMSSPAAVMSLWNATRVAYPAAADRLLEFATESFPFHPRVLMARLSNLYERGDHDQTHVLLEEAMAGPSEEQAAVLQVGLLFFDGRSPDEALPIARRIVVEHAANARAQVAVLEARSSWLDRELVGEAIDNLRRMSGDDTDVWRVAQARSLLAYTTAERSQEDAARAAQVLQGVLRRSPAHVHALLLLSDADFVLGDEESAIANLERASNARSEDVALSLPACRVVAQSRSG